MGCQDGIGTVNEFVLTATNDGEEFGLGDLMITDKQVQLMQKKLDQFRVQHENGSKIDRDEYLRHFRELQEIFAQDQSEETGEND